MKFGLGKKKEKTKSPTKSRSNDAPGNNANGSPPKSRKSPSPNSKARSRMLAGPLATSTMAGDKTTLSKRDIDSWRLDDFLLKETLGTGTFGRVRLCQHRKTKQFFAMKILKKAEVIRLRQVEHIMNERMILLNIKHPFIVNLIRTFQDETNLYMLLEYVPGGELFSHLRAAGRFMNQTARLYAAQIVLAFEYLHKNNIIYRDLKPENLLLDETGFLKIADFGFAKVVTDRTWTLCGTPEYLAPEIIQSKGHNKAVDWWALGILIFEMLAGYPPFFDENPFRIYEKILEGKIEFPKFFDSSAKDLIRRLLTEDRTKRLGCMKDGAADIKRHRWFRGLDWDIVLARMVQPPLKVEVNGAGDTHNFDRYPDSMDMGPHHLSSAQQAEFNDF